MKEYIPQLLTPEALLEKAKSLPQKPGVYLFYDSLGQIIYVGKSRSLKNRVLSYFQNRGKHTPKTEKLVRTVSDLQTIVTSSESEALILENEKIKLHKPKFNIRLKDDKDYPYIRLSVGEAYPRLSFARRKERKGDKSRYFGPYSSSGAVRSAIDTANKLFLLPTCKRNFPRDIGKDRPCLYYHLGKCIGVCTGKVEKEEYEKRIEDVILFLRHDHKRIADSLEKEMSAAAERMDFEKAAKMRDRLFALRSLSQSSQVVRDLHFDADVFGVFSDELGGCINLLSVRNGSVADSTNYHFGADEILTPESFTSLLLSLYRGREMLPRQILIPSEMNSEEMEVLSLLLTEQESREVKIRVPERGDGRGLVQMATENASAAALHRREQFRRDEEVLVLLASRLSLEVLPERIESIDISNSGNDVFRAGVITLENARFLKKAYKSFALERNTPDDGACMYEAISRRVRRALSGDESFLPLPDLFLVDGAATQVFAVRSALADAGLSIPVFGMVKDSFHKTRCLTDGENEISISHDPKLFQFIYGIQEEVHRFSLSRMDHSRRSRMKHSVLTEINGIGEKKAHCLMRAFGSIKAIRQAKREEIAAVKGISKRDAEAVYHHYHQKENEES